MSRKRSNKISSILTRFEVGKLWALTRDNLGNVILALNLTWVGGLIAAVIGSLEMQLLCVGFLVTVPFATL